ncbi:ribosomal RNA large subunit methyltransferase M [Jeongeupia sp. HS-3]|uniref:23S rRNA (cytidine(2498)-2'-O)-methyltransferase RlmM n=1 Tax=Jeongeupia sp. HS-3 TaxID=1009682 RepID=UPI0018A665DB|nr:23S rRNA (cytidine(2498)-2'-O)-methyltransferase RlmM [Jeongeupia sp. HS-3]BCL74940.1 ribosomal RNA large subunit methyltransferase M [Jeongeupia sp. HS-3]
MNPALLLYCRPGFEADCQQEFAARYPLDGRWQTGAGYAIFEADDSVELMELHQQLDVAQLIFTRQALLALAKVTLGERDRLTPITNALAELDAHYAAPWKAVWLEHSDSDEGKPLSGFCKRFGGIVEEALQKRKAIDERRGRYRLHLFFTSMSEAWITLAKPALASPWPLGIARVRMPTGAPSRSTLKLAEALMILVPDAESKLKPGMVGVDLGAAPGGWTFQLVSHGLKVFAIDNGPMKGDMAIHPHVKHLRQDGFKYRPQSPVDWLVCDMVEQPARIAQLIADWFVRGHTRHAVFNLKLPMKKRWAEIERCFGLIDGALYSAGIEYQLTAKQLYHDREEITCYLTRIKGR